MQRLVRENQLRLLFLRQISFYEGKINVFVTTVDFVANDRVTNVLEVNADLVLATGARDNTKQREWLAVVGEMFFAPKFRLRGRAVVAHAIFDERSAFFVVARWCIDDPMRIGDVPVRDGEIFFSDGA